MTEDLDGTDRSDRNGSPSEVDLVGLRMTGSRDDSDGIGRNGSPTQCDLVERWEMRLSVIGSFILCGILLVMILAMVAQSEDDSWVYSSVATFLFMAWFFAERLILYLLRLKSNRNGSPSQYGHLECWEWRLNVFGAVIYGGSVVVGIVATVVTLTAPAWSEPGVLLIFFAITSCGWVWIFAEQPVRRLVRRKVRWR